MIIKRMLIIGTIVVVISFGGSTFKGSTASASPVVELSPDVAENDVLLEALNQPSDEELYKSLHEGKSLHDIAADQGGDIENVIELQMKQLTEQLDDRLRSGSITAEQYIAYKEELKDIVEQSVFTSFD